MTNARKLRKTVALSLESLDERVMPVVGVFGSRAAAIPPMFSSSQSVSPFATSGSGTAAAAAAPVPSFGPGVFNGLGLGAVFGPTTIPTTIPTGNGPEAGRAANVVYNAINQGINRINQYFANQVANLNNLNMGLADQIRSQIQSGLNQAASQYIQAVNAGQTPNIDLTGLQNQIQSQVLTQQNLLNSQLASLGESVNAQFTNLLNRFQNFGPTYTAPIQGAQTAVNGALNTLPTDLATAIGEFGTNVGNELSSAGSLGSVFEPGQDINAFQQNLANARQAFFTGANGNPAIFSTAADNISAPFNTLFSGGANSQFNTAATAGLSELNGTLGAQYDASFNNGTPYFNYNFRNSSLGISLPTANTGVLPTAVTNGRTASQVLGPFNAALRSILGNYNAQLSALNQSNTAFNASLNNQARTGLQGLANLTGTDLTTAQTNLVNSLNAGITNQTDTVNTALMNLNTSTNNAFGNLISTFAGFGTPFTSAINQAFGAFTNSRGQFGEQVNAGFQTLGTVLSRNLGPFNADTTPTGSISDIINTTGAAAGPQFSAAQTAFLGNGQNNSFGALGTSFQNNVLAPFSSTFGSNGTFPAQVTGTVTSLTGALRNNFGPVFGGNLGNIGGAGGNLGGSASNGGGNTGGAGTGNGVNSSGGVFA